MVQRCYPLYDTHTTVAPALLTVQGEVTMGRGNANDEASGSTSDMAGGDGAGGPLLATTGTSQSSASASASASAGAGADDSAGAGGDWEADPFSMVCTTPNTARTARTMHTKH